MYVLSRILKNIYKKNNEKFQFLQLKKNLYLTWTCFRNIQIMIFCIPNTWLTTKICDTLAGYCTEELVGVYAVSNMLHVSERNRTSDRIFLTKQ